MAGHFETTPYEDVGLWGSVLQEQGSACEDAYVADIVRMYDLTTATGIKELASHAIRELVNNLCPSAESAKLLWQYSQCLKKFRYGCTVSPSEMMEDWETRDSGVTTSVPREAICILDDVRRLLAPLSQPFDAAEADGRFGNGAVFEHWFPIERWNQCEHFPYNICDPDDTRWWSSSLRRTARLACVPKDMFKLRSITVEPAEATFLQHRCRLRLLQAAQILPRSSGIPQQLWGRGPEVQRRRALEGSLTGRLSTVDLSNASDSIPWAFVNRVFPMNIVAELERARSSYVQVGNHDHELHMFAGMGNATTFVVESLYFWAVCTAIAQRLRDNVPVSVFGDDIVLSTRTANDPLFRYYLDVLGITMNTDKSGTSAQPGFREACGLVAYRGEELPLLRIQGYRVAKPEELVSLCSLISSMVSIDSLYAPFVRGVGIRVGRHLVADINPPLLPYAPSQEGVYVVDPSESIGGWSYRSRWNNLLQTPEVRVRVLKRTTVRKHVRDATPGEVQGILRGQVCTEFAQSGLGYHNAKTVYLIPTEKVELRPTWVQVPAGDASFPELVRRSECPTVSVPTN